MSTIETQLESLTNHGLIDLMYHQQQRFFSVHHIWNNKFALWQKWLRA